MTLTRVSAQSRVAFIHQATVKPQVSRVALAI